MAIGTTALAVMGGLGSALIQGSTAKKAASSQERAAQKQMDLQREMYGATTERFAPFLEAGRGGLGAYQYELGLGERPEGYTGIQESPAFQRQLEMGVRGIESGASARGKLFSGATGTALERYRTGLASQEVGSYMNRLAGMAQMGQGAAGQQAVAGQQYAAGGAGALANIGGAQAAGAIGMGGALAGGIETGLGLYGYLNQPQPNTAVNVSGPGAGNIATPIQRPF